METHRASDFLLKKGFWEIVFLEIFWNFQASAFHNTSETLCTVNYFNLHILEGCSSYIEVLAKVEKI